LNPIRSLFAVTALLLLAPIYVSAQDDVADVPAQDLTVKDQPKQRYFLIGDGNKAPVSGFGLILVLPGGDGSAEFHPFVKRIYKFALPPGYLVAQLVAVPSDNQRQTIWPTAKLKDPKQTFTTESFIANVVAEVKAKHKIDPARVFTFSWSSGGYAAYIASLAKDTPITGSFVAMSVFPMAQMTPMSAAKGQKYFLLHSPQDKVCAYANTRMARTQLTRVGAVVEVLDYEGGHRWVGDVWGNIAAGLTWLEETKAPATAPTTAPAAR
jgi:predicted esterase